MTHHNRLLSIVVCIMLTSGCGGIKSPITNQYQLTAFSTVKNAQHNPTVSLLITPTEAVNGYQTEQMQYTNEAFTLHSFTKNAWISPPATMIYALMLQSLQQSGYFSAISSGAYISKTQYRLDTQLLKLQQNFIKKPSVLELEIKAVVTRVADNQILASRTFTQQIPCPYDAPYGGVIAANQATKYLTKAITRFVIQESKG